MATWDLLAQLFYLLDLLKWLCTFYIHDEFEELTVFLNMIETAVKKEAVDYQTGEVLYKNRKIL